MELHRPVYLEPVATQKDFIKAHIERTFLARKIALFWPNELEHLSAQQVERALQALMKEGLLNGVVQLYGDEGHLCWSGSPEMYAKLKPFECMDLECEHEHDEIPQKKPDYYTISKPWREKLDALRLCRCG